MDDDAAVGLAGKNGFLDGGEDHEFFVPGFGVGERKKQVGGGALTGDGNGAMGNVCRCDGAPGYEQGAYAFAERSSCVEEVVFFGDKREHAIADLGCIQPALHGPLVKGLDVFEVYFEVEAFRIDLFIDEGVKDECVVRAGAESKGKRHLSYL